MIEIRKYIAEQFKGKEYHFKCDCLLALDVRGLVVDYVLEKDEIILYVAAEKGVIKIGLNHPNLKIKALNDVNN